MPKTAAQTLTVEPEENPKPDRSTEAEKLEELMARVEEMVKENNIPKLTKWVDELESQVEQLTKQMAEVKETLKRQRPNPF